MPDPYHCPDCGNGWDYCVCHDEGDVEDEEEVYVCDECGEELYLCECEDEEEEDDYGERYDTGNSYEDGFPE